MLVTAGLTKPPFRGPPLRVGSVTIVSHRLNVRLEPTRSGGLRSGGLVKSAVTNVVVTNVAVTSEDVGPYGGSHDMD
ncbi:hypothetical protein DM860_009184 [Cuscuta australis]|uniref:Uncharacterized protein n=1 Tax=Cuscuta australis TaxID=267555 RepID=A0A328DA41_9ASTE|nr:hypothetical protein DM860_009184 [Cuscuta australis]